MRDRPRAERPRPRERGVPAGLEETVKIGVTLPMSQDDGSSAMPSYADIRSVARAAEGNGADSGLVVALAAVTEVRARW